jgi:hypothetical protein
MPRISRMDPDFENAMKMSHSSFGGSHAATASVNS